MSILEVNNLSFHYHDHPVFDKLNFKVERGDFLCIVGPNGSGKSTLLKCLLGLIKPTSGTIKFGDNLKENQIGYLPQHTQIPANFPASVIEIVSSGALNQTKLFQPYPKTAINKALRQLNIENLRNQPYNQLSGGQRQKVLLARAIVSASELLILDEPSNNLDYNSKRNFYQTLTELNKQYAIIMVTHDLDHHNLLGNRILSLDHDAPFFGKTAEYVRRVHAR